VSSSEQVGAVLPSVVIVNAKKALDASRPAGSERGTKMTLDEVKRPGTGEPEAPKNVGYAKVWVSGPLRVTDQLFSLRDDEVRVRPGRRARVVHPCLYWREQVDVSSGTKVYWVDFELFESRRAADAVLEYQRARRGRHGRRGDRPVRGGGRRRWFVKWDGCTQLQVATSTSTTGASSRRLTWAVSERVRRLRADHDVVGRCRRVRGRLAFGVLIKTTTMAARSSRCP